ncbi:MAG TPA: Ig-like domain-containing protein [Pseudonocardiaceae bacterium]|jgi:hypothetical protein|nr:Ig-like domain-containing protein [Pseudonocardiaceae bacterium]
MLSSFLPRRLPGRLGLAAVLPVLAAVALIALPAPAHAATSNNVAYVFNFGSGINDTSGPGSGSSIFVNAVTGSAIGAGNTGSYNGASFTNVPVSAIDANPSTALGGFDTVILYEICDIGAHPSTLSAVNSFLDNGGKVMVFDADRCAPGVGGIADYSNFLFPFTTSSPGPQGASGSYTAIESSTLTSGLAVGPQPGDSVGDSNTFTSNAGGWCTSIKATNTLGNTGNVEAYARTVNGGLAIYEGEDFWFTFGHTAHLKQVFDLMLAQPYNPDGLPCTNPASGIRLDPSTATDPVGTSQVETATVVDTNGQPRSGVTVTFNVLSGPDAGATGTGVTNGSGQAQFTVTDTTAPGTDTVQASFTDSLTHLSNKTVIVWTARQTTLTYSGPTTGDFNDPVTLAARLTDANTSSPIANQQISLQLDSQAACTATTDGNGVGQCSVTPDEPAGAVPIHAVFGGSPGLLPSSATATFTVTLEETALSYTGDTHVANGTPAHLSGVLTEDGVTPIAGRSVVFTLGAGPAAQTCTGVTVANGTATCTIASVNQPLNSAGTVGVTAVFNGDGFYRPASASATLTLQFLTGRAFGISANVNLLLLNLTVPPTPDTGQVRTATASSTTTPCTAHVGALLVISADVLCANVTTTLAPGTSTATATVANTTIGIPGLPVITATAIKATSTTTCSGSSGATTIANLTIGGIPVNLNVGPNTTINVAGLAKLVINEQVPVPGADKGLTVNALHLTGLGGAIDVVVSSATSDAHNCG